MLTPDWTFDFGKYKGRLTIEDVCEIDMPYINWCCANIPRFMAGIKANKPLFNTLKDRWKAHKIKIDRHREACAWDSSLDI
jgi:hypothetical protein